jgi:Family of unknown function (DUF5320)
MPSFDGTGPQGKGPMTGKGLGYCVLRESSKESGQMEGWAGIDGVPVGDTSTNKAEQEMEVIQMPFGDGTGPSGMGPMTGRAAGFCAGYPVPGYRNPSGIRGYFPPYSMSPYGYGRGYGTAYTGWLGRWFRRGFGFTQGSGLGRGRRGGRGRFGYRW